MGDERIRARGHQVHVHRRGPHDPVLGEDPMRGVDEGRVVQDELGAREPGLAGECHVLAEPRRDERSAAGTSTGSGPFLGRARIGPAASTVPLPIGVGGFGRGRRRKLAKGARVGPLVGDDVGQRRDLGGGIPREPGRGGQTDEPGDQGGQQSQAQRLGSGLGVDANDLGLELGVGLGIVQEGLELGVGDDPGVPLERVGHGVLRGTVQNGRLGGQVGKAGRQSEQHHGARQRGTQRDSELAGRGVDATGLGCLLDRNRRQDQVVQLGHLEPQTDPHQQQARHQAQRPRAGAQDQGEPRDAGDHGHHAELQQWAGTEPGAAGEGRCWTSRTSTATAA